MRTCTWVLVQCSDSFGPPRSLITPIVRLKSTSRARPKSAKLPNADGHRSPHTSRETPADSGFSANPEPKIPPNIVFTSEPADDIPAWERYPIADPVAEATSNTKSKKGPRKKKKAKPPHLKYLERDPNQDGLDGITELSLPDDIPIWFRKPIPDKIIRQAEIALPASERKVQRPDNRPDMAFGVPVMTLRGNIPIPPELLDPTAPALDDTPAWERIPTPDPVYNVRLLAEDDKTPKTGRGWTLPTPNPNQLTKALTIAQSIAKASQAMNRAQVETLFPAFLDALPTASLDSIRLVIHSLMPLSTLDLALRLLWRIKPPVPMIGGYEIFMIVALCHRLRRYTAAPDIYHYIGTHRIQLNPASQVILLSALARDEQPSLVSVMYLRLEPRIEELTPLNQRRILEALGLLGYIDQAYSLLRRLQQLPENPLVLDQTIVGGLLDKCAKFRKEQTFFLLYEEMTRCGIALNVYNYAIIIRAFIIFDQPRRAMLIFREMITKGLQPTEKTYFAIIGALSQRQDIALLETIFNHFTASPLRDNVKVQTKFLFEFSRLGLHQRADQMIQRFEDQTGGPDGVVVAVMIADAFMRTDYTLVCERYRIYQHRLTKNGALLPAVAYVNVLQSFEQLGRTDESVALLTSLHDRPEFDIRFYHAVTLIQAFTASNN
ncbi:hypothetical protein BJ085DRAFT_37901, partial [Dimargaris cristalligena]